MSKYVWTFPYPVGVNTNHQMEGYGRGRKLTDAAFTWREEARLIVRQSGYRPKPPFTLRIYAFPPADHVKRDLDGILKQTIDAIFLELGHDDRMENLRKIALHAYPPHEAPKLIVRLGPWKEED